MRGFLLFIFIAKATADRLGYAYEPLGQVAPFGIANAGGGSSDNFDTRFEQIITDTSALGITDAFGSGLGGFDSSHSNNINNNNVDTSNSLNSFNFNTAATPFDNTNGANGFGNNYSGATTTVTNQPAVIAEFFKEFYSYKAPPEEDNFSDADLGALGPARKNLRVIFIKAPENKALANAALQLAKQSAEDQTAIYVLTKQTDAAELAQRLQTIKSNHNANKPEVHFVKYRTPEDAVRAQQAIQAQYDALGGPTLSTSNAIAPVLNFATSAGGGGVGVAGFSGGGNVHYGGEQQQNVAAYLPPTLLRA